MAAGEGKPFGGNYKERSNAGISDRSDNRGQFLQNQINVDRNEKRHSHLQTELFIAVPIKIREKNKIKSFTTHIRNDDKKVIEQWRIKGLYVPDNIRLKFHSFLPLKK